MIKNEDKKTTTAQRVGILGIAIFMLGATFALYAGIVINYDSNAAKSAEKQALEQRLQEVYSKYSAESAAQAKELSAQHFDQFVSYKSRVTGFNGADVNELIKTDLVEGDGAEVNDLNYTDYAAYYVGWLQDGTIFDSSFNDNVNPTELKAPLAGSTGMIQGWLLMALATFRPTHHSSLSLSSFQPQKPPQAAKKCSSFTSNSTATLKNNPLQKVNNRKRY